MRVNASTPERSTSEIAASIKTRAESVNRLVDEVSENFTSFARLLKKEPTADAPADEWNAYFALYDALCNITIDKHMQARVERRAMVTEAMPYIIRDLSHTLDSAPIADAHFSDVAEAFDLGLSNMAIIAFQWAVERTEHEYSDSSTSEANDG